MYIRLLVTETCTFIPGGVFGEHRQ